MASCLLPPTRLRLCELGGRSHFRRPCAEFLRAAECTFQMPQPARASPPAGQIPDSRFRSAAPKTLGPRGRWQMADGRWQMAAGLGCSGLKLVRAEWTFQISDARNPWFRLGTDATLQIPDGCGRPLPLMMEMSRSQISEFRRPHSLDQKENLAQEMHISCLHLVELLDN